MESVYEILKVGFVLFFVALGAVDIAIPWDRRDELSCGTSSHLGTHLGVMEWFVIYGSFRITAAFYLKVHEDLGKLFAALFVCGPLVEVLAIPFNLILLVTGSLFDMSWLLIGAALLWHDCVDTGSKTVNRLGTLTLIVGFLRWIWYILGLLKQKFYDSDAASKTDSKEPTNQA
jgi:hypothetical protein